MIKNYHRRKLSRTASARRALLRNLVESMLLHEKIITTYPKAKETARLVEKIITLAKDPALSRRRLIYKEVHNFLARRKLYEVLAPRYKDRPGGYTRVLLAGRRPGDGASLALLTLVG